MSNAPYFLSESAWFSSARMKRLLLELFFFAVFFLAALSSNQLSATTPQAVPETPSAVHPGCTMVYAGFVGALETSNHEHSGVVQIRDILQGPNYSDVCAASFIPVSWTSGRDWILTHFPSHSGPLTNQEAANCPRVIMVGHSTGGWAMLGVARALRAKNIPVELTIQIDSVGFTDYTVPKNVKYSAIFHARDALMFMTTKSIKLEDPKYTTLLANVRVRDASHLSITRDPRIKELVMNSVKTLRTELASKKPLLPASIAAPGK